MKLTYEELEKSIEVDTFEGDCNMWLEYVWELLEKKGLTEYHDVISKREVFKRAYGIIEIYSEFVSIFFDTYRDYPYIHMDVREFGFNRSIDLSENYKHMCCQSAYRIAKIIKEEINVDILFVVLMCALRSGKIYDEYRESDFCDDCERSSCDDCDIFDEFDEMGRHIALEVKSIKELLEVIEKDRHSVALDILNDTDINNCRMYEWLREL